MSDLRTLRLIKLPNSAGHIDPEIIGGIDVRVNAKPFILRGGKESRAFVEIETLAGVIRKIPCSDAAGANKLAETLANAANYRHIQKGKKQEQVKIRKSVDWNGTPMPGDKDYYEEAERLFRPHEAN